jgi:hypothetical protein
MKPIEDDYGEPDNRVEHIKEAAYPYLCWVQRSISEGRGIDLETLQDTYLKVQKAMAETAGW